MGRSSAFVLPVERSKTARNSRTTDADVMLPQTRTRGNARSCFSRRVRRILIAVVLIPLVSLVMNNAVKILSIITTIKEDKGGNEAPILENIKPSAIVTRDSQFVPQRLSLYDTSSSSTVILREVNNASQLPIKSWFHCVGDNWEPNRISYVYRSCQFHGLCWNIKHQEFELAASPTTTQRDLEQHVRSKQQSPYTRISTISATTTGNNQSSSDLSQSVSPVGQTLWWSRKQKYSWFPTLLDPMSVGVVEPNDHSQQHVLLLPESTVWIPIYLPPFKGQSIPTVWTMITKTLVPMFNLLSMFHHHQHDGNHHVMVHIIDNNQQLNHGNSTTTSDSSSTLSCWNHAPCRNRWKTVFSTFMSWTVWDDSFVLDHRKRQQTDQQQTFMENTLVCGPGMAGMGSLAAHGWRKHHGQRGKDYHDIHNVGRGKMWWEFRNYILQRLLHRGETEILDVVGAQQSPYHDTMKKNNGQHDDNKSLEFTINWAVSSSEEQTLSLSMMTKLLEQQLPSERLQLTIRNTKKSSTTDTTSLQNNWELVMSLDEKRKVEMLLRVYNTSSAYHGLDDLFNVTENGSEQGNKNFSSLLVESIRLASISNVYVTIATNGEGEDKADPSSNSLWPALFLPRGATLFLFYDDTQVVSLAKRIRRPRMLHFDIWNNLSHLKVHWLPLPKAREDENEAPESDDDTMNVLIRLLENELWKFASPSKPQPVNKVVNPPDGRLNGVMNLHRKKSPSPPSSSSLHCVGDNFRPWESYIYQSCYMEHLCLDVKNGSFFLTTPPKQESLTQLLRRWNRTDALLSTEGQVFGKGVSLGQNVRLSNRENWFPQFRNSDSLARHQPGSFHDNYHYWELDSDVVWLPFFAEQPNINNPGHLLWDFFLPMFTLLAMFDLQDKQLLLINLDQECSADTFCYNHIIKFLPMLGVPPASLGRVSDVRVESIDVASGESPNIICTRQAVAGIGMLTDHGLKRHGQGFEDYRHIHNVGRGPQFFQFRNHVLRQMGIVTGDLNRPHQTVFSINSSGNPSRRRDFASQIAMVRSSFSREDLVVKEVVLSQLPLSEQLLLMTKTSIFLSVIGGSTSTATFLPFGSCLILYFNDIDDFMDNVKDGRPSMMDWDLWNNASYLRVHWLPIKSMDDAADLETLHLLIRHEIYILSAS